MAGPHGAARLFLDLLWLIRRASHFGPVSCTHPPATKSGKILCRPKRGCAARAPGGKAGSDFSS